MPEQIANHFEIKIDQENFFFTACGDQGIPNIPHYLLARYLKDLAEKNKQFRTHFFLGNNFYPFGLDENTCYLANWSFINSFHKNLKEIQNFKFYAAAGNLDWKNRYQLDEKQIFKGNMKFQMSCCEESIPTKFQWNMPYRYYSLKIVNNKNIDLCTFFAIDSTLFTTEEKYLSTEEISERNKQITWLEGKIDTSKSKFHILISHHPFVNLFNPKKEGVSSEGKRIRYYLNRTILNKLHMILSSGEHTKIISQIIDKKNEFNFMQIISGTGSLNELFVNNSLTEKRSLSIPTEILNEMNVKIYYPNIENNKCKMIEQNSFFNFYETYENDNHLEIGFFVSEIRENGIYNNFYSLKEILKNYQYNPEKDLNVKFLIDNINKLEKISEVTKNIQKRSEEIDLKINKEKLLLNENYFYENYYLPQFSEKRSFIGRIIFEINTEYNRLNNLAYSSSKERKTRTPNARKDALEKIKKLIEFEYHNISYLNTYYLNDFYKKLSDHFDKINVQKFLTHKDEKLIIEKDKLTFKNFKQMYDFSFLCNSENNKIQMEKTYDLFIDLLHYEIKLLNNEKVINKHRTAQFINNIIGNTDTKSTLINLETEISNFAKKYKIQLRKQEEK